MGKTEVRGAAPVRERATTSELERLVDLSVDMLCVTTQSSRFLVLNPAWTLTLGWSEEELRGRRAVELVHPDDLEKARAEATRLLRPGAEVHDFETRFRHRDGSYRTLLWSSRSDGERVYGVARDVTHRKLADEALRKNEQWLRKLVQSAHEGIWMLDGDDRVTWANRRLAEMLGYSVEEIVGRPVCDFFTDNGRSLARARLISRRRGISDSQEVRLIRKDGGEVWVILTGGPLTGEDGGYAGSIDMLVDIGERRMREQALRASEERYRNIVETTTEGVWMIDADHRTTFVNSRMAEMLGYTVSEMLGRPVRDFLLPSHREEAYAGLDRRRRGVSEQREVCYVRKDGSTMWGLASGSPLTNGKGGYGGALAMVSDITGRKRAEKEIARLAAIVEASPDAILSTDTKGRITSWNDAAERLSGYSEEDVLGRSVWTLVAPETVAQAGELGELVMNGGRRRAFRARAVHRDGTLFEIEPSVSAIRDVAGRVTGALAIVRAVS